MDAKMLAPIIDSAFDILPQVGISSLKKGNIGLKEKMVSSNNVNLLVGLCYDVRGNVAYSMSEETAKKVASCMMMGMPVDELGEMALSALSEMANMLAANAATRYSQLGLSTDISPPTLVIGKKITARVSQVRTFVFELVTEAGSIEINIGLEI